MKTTLSEDKKNDLMSHTPFAMPNDPTFRGWSAEKIRRFNYNGYSILYDYLAGVENNVAEVFDNISDKVDNIVINNSVKPYEVSESPPEDSNKIWIKPINDESDSPEEHSDYLSFSNYSGLPLKFYENENNIESDSDNETLEFHQYDNSEVSFSSDNNYVDGDIVFENISHIDEPITFNI